MRKQAKSKAAKSTYWYNKKNEYKRKASKEAKKIVSKIVEKQAKK